MRITAFIAFATLALGATAAPAHWQYTKWGMTPAQVAAASKGKVAAPADPAEKAGNVGTYESGGRTFEAKFYYARGKLSEIMLYSEPGNSCYQLRRDLEGLYGEPMSRRDNPVLAMYKWRDTKKGNVVTWSAIGGSRCILQYEGLGGVDPSGL